MLLQRPVLRRLPGLLGQWPVLRRLPGPLDQWPVLRRLPGPSALSVGSGAIGIRPGRSRRALRTAVAIPRWSDAPIRRAGPERKTEGVPHRTGGVPSARLIAGHHSIRHRDQRSQSLAALRIMAASTLPGGQSSANGAESRRGPVLRRLPGPLGQWPVLRRLCPHPPRPIVLRRSASEASSSSWIV